MSQLLEIVISAIGILLTGIITWLTALITSWLNSKIKDKKLAALATSLANLIMTSVQYIQQTYVDSLKKSGNFNKESQQEAFDKCMNLILTKITPELEEYIKTNFGDVKEYLARQIESLIYSLKK